MEKITYAECVDLIHMVNHIAAAYEEKCEARRILQWLYCIKGDLAARARIAKEQENDGGDDDA